jgi:hypothetical protein
MTGLLLQMLVTYFSTGQYVVLDSGFSVLKSLIELKKGWHICLRHDKKTLVLAGVCSW